MNVSNMTENHGDTLKLRKGNATCVCTTSHSTPSSIQYITSNTVDERSDLCLKYCGAACSTCKKAVPHPLGMAVIEEVTEDKTFGYSGTFLDGVDLYDITSESRPLFSKEAPNCCFPPSINAALLIWKKMFHELAAIVMLCTLANAWAAWLYCTKFKLSFYEAWGQPNSKEVMLGVLIIDVLAVFLVMYFKGHMQTELCNTLRELPDMEVHGGTAIAPQAAYFHDITETVHVNKRMCPPDPCTCSANNLDPQKRYKTSEELNEMLGIVDDNRYSGDIEYVKNERKNYTISSEDEFGMDEFGGQGKIQYVTDDKKMLDRVESSDSESRKWAIQERMKKVVDIESSRDNVVLSSDAMRRLGRARHDSTEETYSSESVDNYEAFPGQIGNPCQECIKVVQTEVTKCFNNDTLLKCKWRELTRTFKVDDIWKDALHNHKRGLFLATLLLLSCLFVMGFDFSKMWNAFLSFIETDEGKVCLTFCILLLARTISKATKRPLSHERRQSDAESDDASPQYQTEIATAQSFPPLSKQICRYAHHHKQELLVHACIALFSMYFAPELRYWLDFLGRQVLEVLGEILPTVYHLLFSMIEFFLTDYGKVVLVILILLSVHVVKPPKGKEGMTSYGGLSTQGIATLVGDAKETIRIMYRENLSEDQFWKRQAPK